MKIQYDSRVDGMTITFSEQKPNRTVTVSEAITLYLRDDVLVLMDIQQASKRIDDVQNVASRYIPQDAPFEQFIEVDRHADE